MTSESIVNVGPYRCGTGQPLMVIAGPCVLESLDKSLFIAEKLVEIGRKLGVPIVFKGSFDKANRTSGKSFRGLGIDEGLKILEQVRNATALPVTTDVHLPEQATMAAEVIDLLQIPAFLARQTDLLVAAAQTNKPINVKKGQFMAPWDMKYVVDKVRSSGTGGVILCERGTFFGYGRLVNDMQSLPLMRQLGVPVCFDATHSVQQPSGAGATTSGNREMVEPLARAATAIGVDCLFFETHPNPDESPSDGPNMVPLDQFEPLLTRICQLRSLVESWQTQ